jgi:hypothetical protein
MAESRARWRFTAGDFFSSHRLERQPLDKENEGTAADEKKIGGERKQRLGYFFSFFVSTQVYV